MSKVKLYKEMHLVLIYDEWQLWQDKIIYHILCLYTYARLEDKKLLTSFLTWRAHLLIDFLLGNAGWVPTYSHIRLTLDHFWATQADSHSTISIIAWYSTLKILIFSTIYSHIRLALEHFWACSTQIDSPIWNSQWLVLDWFGTRSFTRRNNKLNHSTSSYSFSQKYVG